MHAHSKSIFRMKTPFSVQISVYHWATTTLTIAFAALLREKSHWQKKLTISMHAHSKSIFRITTSIFVQTFVYHWATTTPTIAFAASLREEERRSSYRLSSLLVSYIDGGLPPWEKNKPDTSALRSTDIRFRDCWWCLARVSALYSELLLDCPLLRSWLLRSSELPRARGSPLIRPFPFPLLFLDGRPRARGSWFSIIL